MSRVQVKSNSISAGNAQRTKTAKTARAFLNRRLKDINTVGLTSAQIDATIFGSSTNAQPADGIQITDQTNGLLLTRLGGKWGSTTLTIIT